MRPAILNGIEAANEQVRDLGTGAATTLALVEIQDRTIRTYHVGDSAILGHRPARQVKLQTIAHSPIGYAVEAGLIDEKKPSTTIAAHHLERDRLAEMRIEIGPPTQMAARDTLVLASDGLLDNLLPTEIVELVRTGPLDKAVDQLVACRDGADERRKRQRPFEARRSHGDRLPARLVLPVALPVVFFDRIYRFVLDRIGQLRLGFVP